MEKTGVQRASDTDLHNATLLAIVEFAVSNSSGLEKKDANV